MSYWMIHALMALVTALLLVSKSYANSTSTGEEARWLVSSSRWTTLSVIDGDDHLLSMVFSIASSDEGRIFLFMFDDTIAFKKASLTFSEAQIDPSQFLGARCGPEGAFDPQDPRCAKLTISGVIKPVEEESDKQHAFDALSAAHPQMAYFAEECGFAPYEMAIHEENGLWMISGFGGGEYMPASQFYGSSPVRHSNEGFGGGDLPLEGGVSSGRCYDPRSQACECLDEKCGNADCQAAGGIWTQECGGDCDCASPASANGTAISSNEDGPGEGDDEGGPGDLPPLLPRPDFGSDRAGHAGHARWIVSKSLWSTLSTISTNDKEQPFGNIRSVVTGLSGLPVFYLSAPDPSTADIKLNKKITLSFTDFVLAERMWSDENASGGCDWEDPCMKLTLFGYAEKLEDDGQIELAKRAFRARHPRASWLSGGGSHTGGEYYTLRLTQVLFVRNFGVTSETSAYLTPGDYLDWKPRSSEQLAASSSHSFSASMLIVMASLIGFVVAGMLVRELKWLRRTRGYSAASDVDNSLNLSPSVKRLSSTNIMTRA